MSSDNVQTEDNDSETIRKQLYAILVKEKDAHTIEEQDVLILSLRLGLREEKCYTLAEISTMVQMSSERVRQRQYFLLRRKITNSLFFELLRNYALIRKLPPGFELRNIP